MHSFDIQSETAIHHVHAYKLFALRNRNLQFALGDIIQGADTHHNTTQNILDAVRALAHINEKGRWSTPPANPRSWFPRNDCLLARQASPLPKPRANPNR
jgi:hypothetical protein